MRFVGEKGHSLSVAPEPLAIWNKSLEGLESSELKKLKISPENMYLAAYEPVSGFFYEKNSDERSFCSLFRKLDFFNIFLSEVVAGWPLRSKGSIVTGRTVLEYSFGYVVLVDCSFTCSHFTILTFCHCSESFF